MVPYFLLLSAGSPRALETQLASGLGVWVLGLLTWWLQKFQKSRQGGTVSGYQVSAWPKHSLGQNKSQVQPRVREGKLIPPLDGKSYKFRMGGEPNNCSHVCTQSTPSLTPSPHHSPLPQRRLPKRVSTSFSLKQMCSCRRGPNPVFGLPSKR